MKNFEENKNKLGETLIKQELKIRLDDIPWPLECDDLPLEYSNGVKLFAENLEKKIKNAIRENQEKEIDNLSAYNRKLAQKNENQAIEIKNLLERQEELKSAITAARKQGQEEAWALARKILKNEEKGGLPYSELKGIFGGDCIYGAIANHSYAEAVEKIRAWEETEAKKVKAGDLVRTSSGNIAIVTKTTCDSAFLLFSDGSAGDCLYGAFTKIDRTLPVEDLLKQIGEEE